MQHAKFKPNFDAKCKPRLEGRPCGDHLKIRSQVAMEMFAAEPEEVQEQIKRENKTEHEAGAAKHQAALEGMPSCDEEDMEEYVAQA
jgi:hypothetical protein